MNRSRRLGMLLIVAALVAGGCGSNGSDTAPDPIVIGSFDTAESPVIAELYRLALVGEAFPVVHRAAIGDRADVVALLRAGEIDLVPEYLSASLEETFDVDPPTDLTVAYRSFADAWFDEDVLAMLPAGAENRTGFAMRADAAVALGVDTVGELAGAAGGLTFGGPAGCRESPSCLAGLGDVYGASFSRFVETVDVVTALESQLIDVGPVSTSDPRVVDAGLVILEDDRRLVPPQPIVPIMSVDASIRLGDEVLSAVDAVSAALEQRALIQLNRLVASGRAPEDAAAEWLLANGFID